jgi:signal transduction histidine kinase
MRGRRGVQAEVLASLTLVVLAANGLLFGALMKAQAAHVERIRPVLGRALLAESQSPAVQLGQSASGMRWSVLDPDHRLVQGLRVREETKALAARVRREGRPLLQVGWPWQPLLFAASHAGGARVTVAELDPAVSLAGVLAIVLADVAVFLGLGAYLLRRRVVRPLQRLGEAARAVAEGGLQTRVVVEGVEEAAQVAWAFNEMGEALEQRTEALEKAVVDLRQANRSLRRARDGLDRAERLAAVGTLAAGVAHEVGNPMGALLAFLDLARREGEKHGLGEHGQQMLERAGREGERVRVILRQLLDFSRSPRSERRPVSISASAEQAASLLRAQSRYADVEIEVVGDESCPAALADEAIVAQILLNLLLNAADAVAPCESKLLRVRVRAAVLERRADDADDPAPHRRTPDAIECVVEDSGPGVPAEERERIFDPFYTTKPPGEGTGLGLANASRLAEELSGVVELREDCELGGAAFVLRLPIAEPAGQAGLARSEPH